MLPRNPADYRTLLWVFVLTPATVAVQVARPELIPYLCWLSCYFALSCGVIAHNHNHCPTFKSKGMNSFFSVALTLFYGYPAFAWIPTHNMNHHKLVNKAGDATITWRYTNRHVAWVAASYFFVSSYFQSDPINAFIKKAREKNPSIFRKILVQYGAWIGISILGMLALCIGLHGVKTGIYTWVFTMAVPAFFALWTIMLFNYEQHVHADPWSEHNHSRNFDGWWLNFLLFNNGYHTAHHDNAGTHWSKLKEVHESLVPHMDPRLTERNMWWYFIKQYLLAPFFPKFGTVQIGNAGFDPPSGGEVDLACDDVALGEEGAAAT